MTYHDMAEQLDIPFCGGCAITFRSHDAGFVFLGAIHFTERRFTKRGAKNFLRVAAWLERHRVSPEAEWHTPADTYLNDPAFDWRYLYDDSVRAQAMARQLGFRIPAYLFDTEREMTRLLARKHGIRLSKYPAIASWLKR